MALTDNLIHYYKFNESSGNAAASVGSITLTNSGVTYATGKDGNCAQMGTSGTNSSTLYNSSPGSGWFNLGGSTPKSIAFWFKTNATPPSGTNRFFDWRRSAATSGEFSGHYEYNGGTQRFYFYLNGTFFTHNVTLTNGQWYHIALTASSGNTVTFYIDGSSITTSTWGTGTTASNFFQIGNANGSTTGGFGGPFSVEDLGLWHAELSSSDITTLYNGGNGLTYPFTLDSTRSPSGGVAYSSGVTMY